MTSKTQAARLPRFGLAPDSAIGRFWRWWSGELGALMPQSGTDAAHALLIEITPQAVVLRRKQQGAMTELGRMDLQAGDQAAHDIAFRAIFTGVHKRGEQVALWLPGNQCLIKQVELPLAAEENLRQVLGFEMDRHTPFKADQVYFDYCALQRDDQKNRITVKLVVAVRPSVEGALELLARWGAPAQAVYVADAALPDGEIVDLMPAGRQEAESPGVRGMNLGLLLLTLLLAMAALLIPVWQKREVSMALMPVVEEARQRAMATDTLRREQEKLAAEYNFMLNKKQEAPPVVAVLDELSRLLPDGTWVQQLSLKGKELQIQGETGSSSRLVALFENSGILHGANFRSPLTKGSAPNSERYQLVVEVKSPLSATPAIPAPARADQAGPGKQADSGEEAEPPSAQSAVAASKPAQGVSLAPQSRSPGTARPQTQLPARTARTGSEQFAARAQRRQENKARRQQRKERMQQNSAAQAKTSRQDGGGS